MSDQEQPRQQRVNVSLPDELKPGTYANFLVVSHSPHEFTLDFCQLQPGGEPGQVEAQVVSRVRIAPTLVGKVLQALNTNLNGYEEKWGPVKAIG